jgi:pimeloyl-ACP methyl ester carboxylesterase
MPFIDTAHGRIYLTDHRREDASTPPLLLIHGAAATHLTWSIQIRKLNSIAVDLPGHGKSPPPSRTSVPAYAEDMIALMNALKLESAIVAGQSMGGAIAQTLALNYAERVRGMILIGSGAKLSVNPRILEKMLTAQSEIGELFKDMHWGDNADPRLRELGYQQFVKVPAEVAHGDYTACTRFDVRDRLSEIHVPTLVIGGTEDKMTPPRFAEYLAEHIPNAQLALIHGGGHHIVLEQPEAVATTIQDWLEQFR